MRAEEDRLLRGRRDAVDRANHLTALAVGVTLPVGLLIGLGAMLLFTTGISRRVAGLAANASRLKREEPLQPVPPANDEIGRLGIAWQEAAELLEHRRSALARSDERYRTLARGFPNGIVSMFDRDLRYTMVEGPGVAVLGLDRSEIEGKTVAETSAPEDAALLIRDYRAALDGHASVRELHTRGRVLLLHILPVEDENGEVAAGMVVAVDITSRKEAEVEADRLKSFLDSVVENIPNMVFVKEAEGLGFVRLNKAGEELLGIPRKDLMGRNDYDFFSKEEADFFTSKDRQVLDGRMLVDIPEEPIDTANGRRILHTKKIPILSEEGRPVYLLGISEDITERKQVEAELRAAKEEAESASLAKTEFLSRVSHELRTPLNAILGFGQLLEMRELDDEDAESVEHILKAGRHLLDLINEVLDITRIESRELVLTPEEVFAEEIVRETVDLTLPSARERSIDIEVVGPTIPVSLTADRQRLKQVLLNLLSNAVKYNREGGHVMVRVLGKDDIGRIEVEDTGSGIAPEDMPRLFKAFDRLGAESSNAEGSGLGLAVTAAFVDAMNGRLDVTSSRGKGSVFAVELPVTTDGSLPPHRVRVDAR
jgi:PAS domain S-box-containing protein